LVSKKSATPASRRKVRAGIINNKKSEVLPFIPLRNVVVFPYMIVPLLVGRRLSINAVNAAWGKRDKKIILLTQRDPAREILKSEDLYRVGTLGEILQLVKMDDGSLKVLIEGIRRVRVGSFSYSSSRMKKSPRSKARKQTSKEDLFKVKISYV
jgi:ATP-dependent Lon protease